VAGHSHWAQIKHKKAKIDAQRGKLFSKLIREITVAARIGGGNPEFNPRLRTAIEAAKRANMPLETIEKAIKKGTGELEGGHLEEVIYEGYAPGGVAVMVLATTDNKNRTTAEVRHTFTKFGGSLGTSGCVSYLFEKRGIIEVPSSSISEEELFEKVVEAGAEDMKLEGEVYRILTNPEDLYDVKEKLEGEGVTVERAEISWIPTTTVNVNDPETARKVLKLLDALDDLDDTQQVIANFEIPEEIIQKVEI